MNNPDYDPTFRGMINGTTRPEEYENWSRFLEAGYEYHREAKQAMAELFI